MNLPDNIIESVISLKDQYFDLKGLEVYSCLKVPTLRDHILSGSLPCFKVKGKILVKKSEFDDWVETYRLNKKQRISDIADSAIRDMRKP